MTKGTLFERPVKPLCKDWLWKSSLMKIGSIGSIGRPRRALGELISVGANGLRQTLLLFKDDSWFSR